MPSTDSPLMHWLLDADPSIRWQVLRDLTDAPAAAVSAERSRVANEGWGARLLALQNSGGTWGDPASGRSWEPTLYTIALLRHMGLGRENAATLTAVQRLRDHFTWGAQFGDTGFFEGETEPCINGGVLALGAYFGQFNAALLDLLLGEQLEDGGWNCAAPTSRRSSFHTTICVLEGLLEVEKAQGASAPVIDARHRAQEYLLERHLFKRLSTGAIADAKWARFSFPNNWHYDVLRGLDYLRNAGVAPDDRVSEAVELVTRAQQPDGRWLLHYPQPEPPRRWRNPIGFELEEGDGAASRWVTLRALRVLEWYRDE